MEQKLAYLSKEWCEEATKRLKAELPPEKMNQLTSSMVNIYKNTPNNEDKYFLMEMVDGEFVNVETGEGDAPKAEFVIYGNYDVFAKISRAELGAQLALMTGKLKLKGNMVKALKLAKISDRINKVLATIPTDY